MSNDRRTQAIDAIVNAIAEVLDEHCGPLSVERVEASSNALSALTYMLAKLAVYLYGGNEALLEDFCSRIDITLRTYFEELRDPNTVENN